jgi:dipeptidyl-peptidase-4
MHLTDLDPEAIAARGHLEFGVPRGVRIARSSDRVAFLRSGAPHRADQELWLLSDGRERLIASSSADPATAAPEVRAMLERARELASGIVRYTADDELGQLVFEAGGLWWHDVDAGKTAELPGLAEADSPALSPDGTRLAYIAGGAVRIAGRDGAVLAELMPAGEHETVGRPDFIAAEELGRFEGMWWSPDCRRLLVQLTDASPLSSWTIPRPAEPAATPQTVRYPAAGGPNARVSLALLDARDGAVRRLGWDTERFPYLVRVQWTEAGGLTLDLQSRDQRTLATVSVDLDSLALTERAVLHDERWVEPGNGTRAHTPDGELCVLLDRDGRRVLRIGDREVAPPGGEHLVAVLGACDEGLVVTAASSRVDRRAGLAGWDGTWRWLTGDSGVTSGSARGAFVVLQQRNDADPVPSTVAVRLGTAGAGHVLESRAEPLEWPERLEFFDVGDGGSAACLLLPVAYDRERDGPLAVILDPYGGPLWARVVRDRRAYAHARWLAEQGFALLAIDGAGAPGRSPAWERRIAGDFTVTLDSQLFGLEEVAARRPGVLDLDAVGIRGWSFGGYLAALAAIRRPDVVRAAAVGAPVSDWSLYDTHYTERYLGSGEPFRAAADRSSLPRAIEDAVEAGRTPSPMLIMHGFEDDNVVVAHAVRLAESLTAHAIPHASLLLSSLTHIGRTPMLAKIQRLECEFLARHLRPGAAAR